MDIALLNQSLSTLKAVIPELKPSTGLILGSGWGAAIGSFTVLAKVKYSDIPGLGSTGVVGHAGELVYGELSGIKTLIFCGRRHLYEGEGFTPVAVPVFLLKMLSASRLILTNAAGGINKSFKPGDLMLVSDHLNLTGSNPLIGPHTEIWGPRFPDMSAVYNKDLCEMIKRAAALCKDTIKEGVYAQLNGPSFETPAEIRMLTTLGADAVGMSTAVEALLANAAGLKVAAISCISNLAAGISKAALTHEEVFETTSQVLSRIERLFRSLWTQLAASDSATKRRDK